MSDDRLAGGRHGVVGVRSGVNVERLCGRVGGDGWEWAPPRVDHRP